jgi:nucleoside-diphosphate-sugar epimerase
VVQRASVGRLPLIGTGGALVDTTYASNAVGALIAALDRCDKAHGQALVVSNGEPRPIAELLGAICRAAGVPAPRHHVPRSVASGAGWLAEQAWSLAARRRGSADQEPPLTRFLVEQLSTAHWFDQRETRQVLAWQPRIGLDEGFNRLTRWFQPEAQP